MSANEEISKVNAALSSAFANGAAKTASKLYTDDGWLMAPHIESFKGRTAIETAFQGMFDGGITGLSLKTGELEEHGDTAIETGDFFLSAGDAIVDRGKFVVVWKNIDGHWLLHRDIINSNLPMPE